MIKSRWVVWVAKDPPVVFWIQGLPETILNAAS